MKRQRNILIVEDDGLVVNILKHLLEKEGFKTIIARDGNEGAEAVENSTPDLIIIDLMLPYQSGLEVASLALKKNKNVPIIVVSSLGLIDDTIKAALALGVHSVVSKPFAPAELLHLIIKVLS